MNSGARAIVILGMLLYGVAAHAQSAADSPRSDSTPALHLVVGSFITLAGADLAVTTYRIGRGDAREVGFGASWQNSPVAFAVSKSAMTAVFAYGVQRIHKTRPKTALVIGIAATVAEGYLVVRGATLTPRPR